jgi:hypothetical protein
MLVAYGEFESLSKRQRIARCLKNGLLKETWGRRIYQMIRI